MMGCCRELDRFERAALIVRNALHGRRPAVPTALSVQAARIYHSVAYRVVYVVLVLAQLCLAAVEPPSSVQLTPAAAAGVAFVDFLALAVVAGDLVLQLLHHGLAVWSTRGWVRVKLVVWAAVLVNLCATLAVPGTRYVLRCLRPLFLIERLRNVRQVAINIASSMPRIFNVLVLLFIHLMVFAVLGFVLFAGVDADNCVPFRAKDATFCSTFSPPETCSDYFNTLEGSVVQLFELVTAANFPRIAEPAYRCNPASMLFFAAFIVVGIYLLLSLTLAVAANTFQSLMADEVVAKYGRAFGGFDMAWEQLATLVVAPAPLPAAAAAVPGAPGSALALAPPPPSPPPRLLVSRADFLRFLALLRPRMDPDACVRLFAVFDPARLGGLDQRAFRRFFLHFGAVSVRRRAPRRPRSSRSAGGVPSPGAPSSSGPARHRVSSVFLVDGQSGGGGGGAAAGAGAGGDATVSVSPPPLGGAAPGDRHSLAVSDVSPLPSPSTAGDDGWRDEVESLDELDDAYGDDAGTEIEALDMEAIVGSDEAVALTLDTPTPDGGHAAGGVAASGSGAVANPLAAAAAAAAAVGAPPPPPPLPPPVPAWGAPATSTPNRLQRVHLLLASSPAATAAAASSGSAASNWAAAPPPLSGAASMGGARRRPHASHLLADAADGVRAALSTVTTSDGYPGEPRSALPRGVAPGSVRARAIGLMRKTAVMLALDAAIVLNTAAVLVQLSVENDEEDSTANPLVGAMQAVEWAMLAVFLAEVVAKALLWGPVAYWRESRFNQLDTALLVVACVGAGLDKVPNVPDQVSTAASFVRFLRLVRVLRLAPGFGLTVGAFGDIVPVLLQYALCVTGSFYFFALVGVEAFGGRFVASNPAVAASSYGETNYYLFNFDSLLQAGVSLLFLVVLNDWPILMDAAVAAVGKAGILYFAAFWLVNVVVILNVVIAFLIESFTAQKTKRELLARLEAGRAARRAAGRFPKTSGAGEPGRPRSVAALAPAAATPVQPGDWRDIVLRSGVDFSGYHLSRTSHHWDVLDEIYREQLRGAFPDTFAS